jgi:hypothetical protein
VIRDSDSCTAVAVTLQDKLKDVGSIAFFVQKKREAYGRICTNRSPSSQIYKQIFNVWRGKCDSW